MNGRLKILAMAATLALSTSGFAQTTTSTDPNGSGDIRNDRRDIRQDKRDIRQDELAGRDERADLQRAENQLRMDRANHASRSVLARDKAAVKADKARLRAIRHDIKKDKKDVRNDFRDVKQDRRNRRRD